MYYTTWKPATDVFYSGRQWLIRMELAGVSPAEIDLVAQRDQLTVRGRRRDVLLQKGYICHSLEISYTRFEKQVVLPGLIDTRSIRTEYRDGILRIMLEIL